MEHVSEAVNRLMQRAARTDQNQPSPPSTGDCSESKPAYDPWLGFDPHSPALKAAQMAVGDFTEGRISGLLIAGPTGCGKTHLARVVHTFFGPTESLLVPEPELLADIRAAYDDDGSERRILGRIRGVPILILDDVGAAYVKSESLPWLQEKYWRILDRRAERRLPLMITTNLSLPDLAHRLGGRAFSRLAALLDSKANVIDLSHSPDHRLRRWQS